MKKILLFLVTTIASISTEAQMTKQSFANINQAIKIHNIKLFNPSTLIPFDSIYQMHCDPYFFAAFDELSYMLDNNKPQLKRATFITEWAYHKGKIEYGDFCDSIRAISQRLSDEIKVRNIGHFKTAPNAILFDFFTKPSTLNNFKSYSYDYEDAGGTRDIDKTFVTKLMRTHSGQCTSLPLFYKILCNELGGTAYLAKAPNHLYIKHIAENGKWVNVELTTGCFNRDIWYIETMGIKPNAIKNKTFLAPMSEKEEIAFVLYRLALMYRHIYEYYDAFTLLCSQKILSTVPDNCYGLYLRLLTLHDIGYLYVKTNGQRYSHFMNFLNIDYLTTKERIDSIGFTGLSAEEYIRNLEKAYRRINKDLPESMKNQIRQIEYR